MTTVSVSLEQQADYRFEIRFGEGISSLIADEPSPLLIRHGLLQSPDAVQLEPVEGLRHLSPSKVYE